MTIKNIEIPAYNFDMQSNPYAFDAETPQKVDEIAQKIELAIGAIDTNASLLIRGIQSGHHNTLTRDELIQRIQENGTDTHDGTAIDEIHAAEFAPGVIHEILKGFHTYKPKCEERPQFPVDIWMIFDQDSFENIEYMHPRHKVPARDKWKLKNDYENGLRFITTIN